MQLPLLPVLPALPPLPPLPVVEPYYSPWFPMSRNPWAWGYYEIKCATPGGTEMVVPDLVLWDRLEWAWPVHLRRQPIAWRGLARPAA